MKKTVDKTDFDLEKRREKKTAIWLKWKYLIIPLFAIALNILGKHLSVTFNLPIWMDNMGTFVCAMELGPIAGAIVAAISNVLYVFIGYTEAIWYITVSMAIGFVTGLMYKRRSITDLFYASCIAMVAGFVSVILSVPINQFFYGGYSGNEWGDAMFDMVNTGVQSKLFCNFVGEAFVDIPDKAFSMFIAMGIIFLQKKFSQKKYNIPATALLILFLAVPFISFYEKSIPVMADESKTENYQATIYDRTNGLEVSEVNAIVQTDDGFIWVGTYSGLFRYDGSSFDRVNVDSHIKNVVCLFVDRDENLWIGTNDGGLIYYNRQDYTTRVITVEDGLGSNSVRKMCQDEKGNIYIGTVGDMTVMTPDGSMTNYSLTFLKDLKYVGDGIVGGVTNSGTLFFMKDGRVIASDEYKEAEWVYYTTFAFDGNGDFRVGTSSNFIRGFTFEDGEFHFTKNYSIGQIPNCSKLIYSPEKNGYLLCSESAAALITKNGSIKNYSHNDYSSAICDVLVDKQENIWFASNKQGIMKLSENVFTNIYEQAGLEKNVVNSLLLRDNNLYVGTDSGMKVIDVINYSEKKYSFLDSFEGVRIRNIFEDSKGNLWVATYGKDGLVKLSKDGKLKVFNEAEANTLGGRFRTSIELQDGTILSASNTGLNYIKNDKVIKTLGEEDGLVTPQILCMYENADGLVYAGSDGDGIYVIKDMEIVDHIDMNKGLKSLVVMRIVPYRNGLFYVTGSSLYYDDGVTVRELDKFPYSNNFYINIMENGDAWVGSGAGIYIAKAEDMINNEEYSYELLNRSRGLDSSLTSNSWDTIDGDILYLCCNDGVRSVSTKEYDSFDMDYPISISSVYADDVEIHEIDGVYNIPSTAKRIDIDPAVLNFSLSNPNVHMYMEEVDEVGIKTEQDELGPVSYTNLQRGKHTFHIEIISYPDDTVIRDETFTIYKASQKFEEPYFIAYAIFVAAWFVAFIAWMIARLGSMAIINSQYSEISRVKEELEKANNAKGLFLANMSHEIRTPLNAVIGMNELIIRESDDDQIREYAAQGMRAGKIVLDQINDILDFSKIDAGKMTLVPDDYSLGLMIMDIVGVMGDRARKKDLDFIMDIDNTIPDELYGDMNKVRQILLNIVSNAVKYTKAGSVTFTLRQEECEPDKDGRNRVLLVASIRDTGIGIKDEDKDKLFEGFERLDAKKNRSIEGTGLGLAITKKLVDMMGGSIEVKSKYGNGSTFTVRIPQVYTSDKKLADFKKSLDETLDYDVADDVYIPGARILLVDDNEMNRTVFISLLSGSGATITEASGGKQALELSLKNEYDIIFLDHFMPEMDGVETLKRIREGEDNVNKDKPIFVLTANVVSGIDKFYAEQGFTGYLEKPIVMTKLNAELRKHLDRYLQQKPASKSKKNEQAIADSMKQDTVDSTVMAVENSKAQPSEDTKMSAVNENVVSDRSVTTETTDTGNNAASVTVTKEMLTEFKNELKDELVKEIVSEIRAELIRGLNGGGTEIVKTDTVPENDSEFVNEEIVSENEQVDISANDEDISEVTEAEEVSNESTESGRLDEEAGLAFMGGNKDIYKQMLKMFVNQSEDKIAEMQRLLDADELDNYVIQIHAMKGNARTVGLSQLADAAYELEMAGRNGDKDFVTENHPTFVEDLRRDVAEVNRYIES